MVEEGSQEMPLGKKIGTIRHLRRYPVKSMKGEDVASILVTKNGLEGDRRFAFVDERAENKAFPWMTARQKNEMLLFEPRIVGSGHGLEVKTPEGEVYLIEDPSFEIFLERRFGYALKLKQDTGGCYDDSPISLIGLPTVRALGKEVEIPDLSHLRFRTNIYADWDSNESFFEDGLVGKSLKIGRAAAIRVVKKNSRCVIPTLDPLTAKPSPTVLRHIEQKHGGCVGVYATVESEGIVEVGDEICVSP